MIIYPLHPGAFSAATMIAARSRSSAIVPQSSTTPFLTMTLIIAVGAHSSTCQLGHDPVPDGLVAGGSRFDLAGEPSEGVNEIGTADDADDLVSAHDGQALDAPLLHQPHDLVKPGVQRRRSTGRPS